MYINVYIYICICINVCIQYIAYVYGLGVREAGSGDRSGGQMIRLISGGTKRATSVDMPLLRLQSSEGKLTSREYRARTQVLLQARKLHVYGSGMFGVPS